MAPFSSFYKHDGENINNNKMAFRHGQSWFSISIPPLKNRAISDKLLKFSELQVFMYKQTKNTCLTLW